MNTNKFSLLKFKADTRSKLLKIQDALIEAGIDTPLQLKLALAQVLYETGQFTSKSSVAKLNNNYSGIKWINKPYQKATKGSPVPAREGKRNDPNYPLNYYAKFATDADWAADFIRILSLGANKPIEADNVEEYVNRLKANRYFSGDINSYKKNVRFFFDKID